MFATLLLYLAAIQPGQTAGRELLADPGFDNGFLLSAAEQVPELGVLRTSRIEDAEPSWRIAQWATREEMKPGRCVDVGDGKLVAENRAKRVVVTKQADGPTTLWLEVRGGYEYDGHMRAQGEAWPHLLIEQRFDKPIVPREWKQLRFRLEARIPFCKAAPWSEGKLDRNSHTAQVTAFWTVHNTTDGNPDKDDMIWFGLPVFDARHEIPPAYYAVDSGKADATGKFICMLDGKRFWKRPTGDGGAQALDVDLLPLLRDGLASAQERGFLKHTRFEDLAIDSFNLGWEAPGPYDAAFEAKGLSLWGVGTGP